MYFDKDYRALMKRGKWQQEHDDWIRKNSYRRIHEGAWILAICIGAIIWLLLIACIVHAEPSDSDIVKAIYKAEGCSSKKGCQYYYGIRSVHYASKKEAKKICYNTIRRNRDRFKQRTDKGQDFISFLASRYCPTKGKLSKAEKKLNGNWERNVRYYLAKNETTKQTKGR